MKKISSLILAVFLTVSLVPFAVLAATDPDLTVSNLTITASSTEGEYFVTVDYANVGGTDVDPSTGGYNLATLNETDGSSSYNWSTLADVTFLTILWN
jgi:hypothetical protein